MTIRADTCFKYFACTAALFSLTGCASLASKQIPEGQYTIEIVRKTVLYNEGSLSPAQKAFARDMDFPVLKNTLSICLRNDGVSEKLTSIASLINPPCDKGSFVIKGQKIVGDLHCVAEAANDIKINMPVSGQVEKDKITMLVLDKWDRYGDVRENILGETSLVASRDGKCIFD